MNTLQATNFQAPIVSETSRAGELLLELRLYESLPNTPWWGQAPVRVHWPPAGPKNLKKVSQLTRIDSKNLVQFEILWARVSRARTHSQIPDLVHPAALETVYPGK